MVVADCHVHTRNSDGTLALADLPAVAREAGLDAVAVTDHDRTHPDLDAPVQERDGVTVIHGIELRVAAGDQRVDLLGYGVDPTPALRAELDRLQRDRVERARRIVTCLEDRLDSTFDVTLEAGVGRPHIARAVADATDLTVQAVFDEYIADGRPCYVARDVPDFERGRALLADACGLVGLAHPYRYEDPDAALALVDSLDALEVHYPYDRPVDDDRLAQVVSEHDLVPTGGSDAHGTDLGLAGLDREGFRRFRSRL